MLGWAAKTRQLSWLRDVLSANDAISNGAAANLEAEERDFQEKGWIICVGKCAKVETHSPLSNWLMLQHHALLLIECWTSESPCLLDAFCLLCKQIPSFGPFFEWAWPGQSTGRGFEAVTRMHFLDPGLSSVLSSTVGQIEFLLKQKFYNITCQFHKWGDFNFWGLG